MSATGLITLVFIGLIVLKATSREVGAGPAPAIDSVSLPKSISGASDDRSLTSNAKVVPLEQLQQATLSALTNGLTPTNSATKQQQLRPTQLNGEKLRRGLSNFLNQLNPAPYFVPPAPAMTREQHQSLSGLKKQQPAAGSQAEPATIINIDGPTANALIKGPNRLAAPLRWGRK